MTGMETSVSSPREYPQTAVQQFQDKTLQSLQGATIKFGVSPFL